MASLGESLRKDPGEDPSSKRGVSPKPARVRRSSNSASARRKRRST